MPLTNSIFTVSVAASLLSAVPAALAQVQGSAQLSGLYVQVIDLDLSDGIAAAVTFDGGAQVHANVTLNNGGTHDFQSQDGPLGGVLGVSSALGVLTASASTQAGNTFVAGAGPGALAAAWVMGADSRSYASADALQSAFTLTAHSLLVMTATGSASSASTVLGETAYAVASLLLSRSDNSAYSYAYASSSIESGGTHYSDGSPALEVSFINLGGSDVMGYASAGAFVDVSGIGAVPEPASMALMLAGLVAVGAVARRRQPH